MGGGHEMPTGKSGVRPQWRWCSPGPPGDSLDAVILLCKLLIIEAKLVHEGGRHLLDLVLRESLGERASRLRLRLPWGKAHWPQSCSQS